MGTTREDDRRRRADAEARLSAAPSLDPARSDLSALVHELRVHQIELELQNEELRRSQQELDEARRRYVELYDFAPVGYLQLDARGRILGANLTAETLLGVEREKLVGRPLPTFIQERDGDRWHLARTALLGKGPVQSLRLAMRRADGAPFVAQVTCERRDGQEAGAELWAVLTDVTGLQAAEEALQAAHQEIEQHLTNTPLAIIGWGQDQRITRFGGRAGEIFGWSEGEIVGKRVDELPWVLEEDRARVRSAMDRTAGSGLPGKVTVVRSRRKDGSLIQCEWYVSALFGAGGELASVLALVQDVTERERTRAALQESEARFRALAESAPVGVFQIDGEGMVTYLNPVARRMTGTGVPDAARRDWIASVHPDDRERVVSEWTAATQAGREYGSQYRLAPPGGGVTWVRSHAAPFRSTGGTGSGYVGILLDVTEELATERKLALTSRLAALGTLVAGVAHEINNPLTGIVAGLGTLTEEIRDFLGGVEAGKVPARGALQRGWAEELEVLGDATEGAARIARIVKDLAIFGGPRETRARVRLHEVARGALRWVPPSATAVADIRFEDRGGPEVEASRGQIEQVVVNLVTNAAKATQPGKRGRILVRTGSGSAGTARLEVVDEGTGISPENLEKVFDPFFTTRAAGVGRGTGLGLAICQSFVMAHGGTLTVESAPGKGSTFRMELPAAPSVD